MKLVGETIPRSDIDALADWLKTYPRLTKGPLTAEFEARWAKWLGVKHAVYVNSGSSANLLAVAALDLPRGSRIGVPAVSWSTDLAPVIQLGYEPVLIDCNLDDLSVDLSHLEAEVENLDALILVSVLGLPPNMTEVMRICEAIPVIEDCCEAQGSRHHQRLLGTFGSMSTFSLFYGHHLSTIEGGMVCTDSDLLHRRLLALRSHGWSRDWPDHVPSFDESFRFYLPGYNLRNTEIGAFLGLRQIERIDGVVAARSAHYHTYRASVDGWKPAPIDGVSSFGYPLLAVDRPGLLRTLHQLGVECRPIISGNHARQPFFYNYDGPDLPNADIVHDYGLYLPNHPEVTAPEIQSIMRKLNEDGYLHFHP